MFGVPISSNYVIPVFGLEGAPSWLALYWPLAICGPRNIRSRNKRKDGKRFQATPTFISIVDLNGYLDSGAATGPHTLWSEAQYLNRLSVSCDSERQLTGTKLTIGADYHTMSVAIFEAKVIAITSSSTSLSHDRQGGRRFP